MATRKKDSTSVVRGGERVARRDPTITSGGRGKHVGLKVPKKGTSNQARTRLLRKHKRAR